MKLLLLRKRPVCPPDSLDWPGVPATKISPRFTSDRLIFFSLVPDIANNVSVLPIDPLGRNPPAIIEKNTAEEQS